jgi:hypothetical protein
LDWKRNGNDAAREGMRGRGRLVCCRITAVRQTAANCRQAPRFIVGKILEAAPDAM